MNVRLLLAALLVSALPLRLFTQPTFPYQFSPKTEIGIGVPALTLAIVGKVIDPQTPAFTQADLDGFQPSQIHPRWDRAATRNYSLRAQHRSDVLLKAALAVPLTLALSSRCRQVRQGGVVLGMGAEAALLTYGLTNTLKNTIRRPPATGLQPGLSARHAPAPRRAQVVPVGTYLDEHRGLCIYGAGIF